MPDNDGVIRSQVIIDTTQVTEAEAKFKTLQQQIRDVRTEMDKNVQGYSNGQIGNIEYEEKVVALQQREVELLAQKSTLDSQFATTRDRALQEESKVQQAITKTQQQKTEAIQQSNKAELDELSTLRQMTRELENQKVRYNEQRNSYMAQQTQSQIDSLNGLKNAPKTVPMEMPDLAKYATLQTQIRAANNEAQQFYTTMMRTKDVDEKLVATQGFSAKRDQVKQLTTELAGYNEAMGIAANKTGELGALWQKLQSHARWIVAGGALAVAVAIPAEYLQTMSEIERGMAGMEQVLQKPIQQIDELKQSLQTLNNQELSKFADSLSPEDINKQATLNKLTEDYINIASRYGESIKDVIESGKLWGRAYKDLAVVQTMVNASSKLAVADNFDMITANKALESSVMQWGFAVKNANDALTVSNRIIDSWTSLAHNYTVSAQTMATANERMASSAKLVGVNFDTAQALVAVIARKTQAEGAEIGNALKSIFASIHTDKAIGDIEKLGIAMYNTGADGTKSFRNINDVLVELMLKTQDTNQNVEKLFKDMSGGKWQWNKMGAVADYQEFIKALSLSINSKDFTQGQVAAQLDTLYRKVQTLNVELQRMATGNGGMKTFLKSILDGMTNLVKFLDRIPAATYNMLLLVAGVRLVEGAFTFMSARITATKLAQDELTISQGNGARAAGFLAVSETEAATATGILATAQRGLSTAVAFLGGPLNAILLTITAASVAYGAYTAITDQAGNATDQMNTKLQSLNSQYQMQQAQLSAIDQYAPQIDTLAMAYKTLLEQKEKYADDAEKTKEINDEIGNTHKVLSNIISEAAVQRMKDAGFTEDAVNKEKQAYIAGKESLSSSMNDIRTAIIETSAKVVEQCNVQIRAIKDEAVAFDKAADAIGAALGKIAQFEFEYYRGKANYLRSQADFVDREASDMSKQPWYAQIGLGQVNADLTAAGMPAGSGDVLRQDAQAADDKAEDIKNQAIQKIAADGGTAAKLAAALASPEAKTSNSGGGTGEVDPNAGRHHSGNGPTEPANATTSLEHKEDMLQYNEIMSQRKKIIDATAISLNNLAEYEKVHGVTDATVAARDKILNDEEWSLGWIAKQLDGLTAKYISNINGLADATGATLISNTSDLDKFTRAIAKKETGASSDPYHTWSEDGNGNYGKYQMGSSEWERWSKDLYGYVADKEDPDTQDAVAKDHFAKQFAKYGNWHDVAVAHNGGDGRVTDGSGVSQGYASVVDGYMENDDEPDIPIVSGLGDLGMDSATWKAQTLAQKRDFIQAHKEQVREANALINEIEAAIKSQNAKMDTKKLQSTKHLQRQDEGFKGINSIISQAKTSAEQQGTEEESSFGLGITQVQKDSIKLKELNTELDVMAKELAGIKDKGSDNYKKAYDDYLKTKMSRDKIQKQQIAEDTYAQTKSDIDYSKGMAEASSPRNLKIAQGQDKSAMEIKYAQENIDALYKKVEDLIELSAGVETPVIKATKLQLAQALKDMDTLKNAYDDKLKESEYSLADDLLLKGNTFRKILNDVWKGIAEDALKAAMGIKNNSPSAGSILLGIGKPSNAQSAADFFGIGNALSALLGQTTKSTSGIQDSNFGITSAAKSFGSLVNGAGNGKTTSTGNYDVTSGGKSTNYWNLLGSVGHAFKWFANGGVTDGPSIAGEDGKEIVIPIEKNIGNSENLVKLAARHIGMSTPVVASVSKQTSEAAQSAVSSSANREHLDKLDTQITLMSQQNTMLLHMINNGTGGNSSAIAQPIIMSQSMSTEEFATMYNKAASLRNIK